MGWSKPTDVLKREGLVTTETPIDPRAISRLAQQKWDMETAIIERQDYERRKTYLTRSKYI